MGTKVQCKSYLPGYNFTRDFTGDANGVWSLYYDDRIHSGHPYNGFMMRQENGYSEYDKEMLKRTMLEHEAIFRKQVYELHRLYRIQKNLMDELRRKELHRLSVSSDMAQANSILSHMPNHGSKKMWQMPCFPLVNRSDSRAVTAASDNLMSPLNGRVPVENGVTSGNSGYLEPELKSFPRKTFNLQLPADVYIECEIPKRSEKDNAAESLLRASASLETSTINLENDVRLTLGTGEDPTVRENNGKTYSHAQNGLSTWSLADLNAPVKDTIGSATSKTFHPGVCLEGIPEYLSAVKSQTIFTGLQRDVFKDRHKDEGTTSNSLKEEMDEKGRDWPLFKNEFLQNRSNLNSYDIQFCSGKFPASPEAVEVKHNKTHEILLPAHHKREVSLREKPNHDTEISGGSLHSASADELGLKGSLIPGSYAVVPLSGASMASPQVSSWTKTRSSMSHIPFTVQAFPCFNVCDKQYSTGDSKSPSRFGTELASYQNGFHYDPLLSPSSASSRHHSSSTYCKQSLHVDCSTLISGQSQTKGLQRKDMKSARDLNLDQTLPNGVGDDLTGQQELPGGISWLRNKPSSNDSFQLGRPASKMEMGFSHSYCHLLSSFDAAASECKVIQEEEKVLFPNKTQDMSSTLPVKESKMLKNEASDSSRSKRIFGFPILDQIQHNALSSPSISNREQSSADEKASFRNHINLNSLIPCTEYTDKLVISPNCKADIPSPLSRPNDAVRIAPEINLEAPILTQGGENALCQEESIGVTHHVSCTEMALSKMSSSWETECSHEALTREAAENIVAMSLDKGSLARESICCPSCPAPCDSLYWFAEVTLDVECTTDVGGGRGSLAASADHGLDLFEFMTLKLKETNVDEHLCRKPELENQKGDAKGATSLLLMKPRRGLSRKRRQRRDFQKDILPGLASLSRHEVTEDLQTIGGLVRASGRSWQTSVTRRNVGRNRPESHAKGTRRPRSLAISVEEVHASTPAAPLITTEFMVDGSNVIGWGRTTRRCRRQRCPPGNNISVPNLKV